VSEADDQAWMAALAGRQSPSDGPDAREAQRLREAMLEHLGAQDYEAPGNDPERVAALIERARREGLLVPRTSGVPRRRTSMVPIGIAATIICLAGTTALWNVFRGATTAVQRSGRDEIVHLQAADPVQLKQQIIRELQSTGVTARGYESLGVQGIDADLPRPTPPEVQRILQQHGIPTPADGVLRVEIGAQTQK
jgi:hypothetical protein